MVETSRKTILMVDDDPAILSSLRRLLRREGWNVLTAADGPEGLALLQAGPIDLVISDMRMPGMDGATFLKRVKEGFPKTVRVILTGYADRDAVTKAFAEADLYQMISKPWDDEEVKEIIRGALGQAAGQEEVESGMRQIINEIDSLPALPRVYVEMKRTIRRGDEISADEVAAVLMRDPAIAAHVLQIANSAFFGQRRKVDTVSRAIVVLGMELVESLVLSTSVFHVLGDTRIDGFDHEEFWRHSVGCGLAARSILHRYTQDPQRLEEATLSGLLHDLGKRVFAQYMPERYRQVVAAAQRQRTTISASEQQALGTTHPVVGGYLADWWQLPATVVEVIRWHHDPMSCRQDRELVNAVHLADVLTHRLGIGASGNGTQPELMTEVMKELGLDSTQLEYMQAEFQDCIAHTDF